MIPAPDKQERRGTPEAELFHVADWPMHYMLAIDRQHVHNMAKILKPFDCSPLMWRVVSVLSDQDGRSVAELAETTVIERSNLSRLLDAMEEDGLVTRSHGVEDKRQTMVYVTTKGRSLFERSLPAVLGYYQIFLADISPPEMTVLMKVIRTIKRNVMEFDARPDEDEAP
ncbi:MarR family transcriptional regulator [Pigmentiphaga sp. H8]|uniref:MarR family winged helix-turn-helix transcriptional regulator n=1 Tax=unclassified Pigmentiphaga TaxID=2626614 RepID=UPI000F5A7C7C|nr:MarR family transcriptional regulator [Pigmentiphaga sp. H8]AZG10255.1 MarR family transcriptional regulator [Pigmentiphaga sp. H8]